MQAVLLTLALVGLWHHRRDGRAVMLLGGVAVCYVLPYWMVSNLWSRYVYPVMPLVLILAAGGCVALVRWGRRLPAR